MPFSVHPHMLRHGCGYKLANQDLLASRLPGRLSRVASRAALGAFQHRQGSDSALFHHKSLAACFAARPAPFGLGPVTGWWLTSGGDVPMNSTVTLTPP